jgi:hypothetical protein
MADVKGTRSSFLINLSLALALVILIASVALIVKPAAPPSIAEFAPEAVKAITKAPKSEAGLFGDAAGGKSACLTPQTCTTTTTTTTTPATPGGATTTATTIPVGVPSSLQCFEWPDGAVTQTFDPQSPPCVATWPDQAAGNGGATSMGVTATTITVAADAFDGAPDKALDQDIVDFFNSHFELYGRQFQLVYPAESGDEGDPTDQEADAQNVAADKPFADSGLYVAPSTASVFMNALADDHIIGITDQPGQTTSGDLAAEGPYEWSYSPTIDLDEANLAAMICRSLPASRPAQYGGTDVNGKTRKWAILVPDAATNDDNPSPETTDLTNGLSSCGVTPGVVTYDIPSSSGPSTSGDETQFMLTLRNDGYTSLIYLGSGEQGSNNLMAAANDDGYEPEWVSSGVGDLGSTEADSEWGEGSATQTDHLIGMGTWSKYLTESEEPWFEAYTDESSTSPSLNSAADIQPFYEEMLVIASGVQSAGPDLTPTSFANGLTKLDFPNPGAAGQPFYQATVGFGSGTHVMQQDFSAWWWNGTAQSQAPFPDDYPGASCEVDSGQRWSLNTWPTTALPFDQGKSC